MKIALLHLYLAAANGDPRMILSIGKEFREQGHEVKVYCSEFNPIFLKELHKGLDIEVVPPPAPLGSVRGASGIIGKSLERIRRNSLYTKAAQRIANRMDQGFDFVFCENDYTYKAGGLYKKSNPQAKIIWIMNNPPFYHSDKDNIITNIASLATAFWEAKTAKKFAPWIDWAVVYDKKNKADAEDLGFKVKLIGNPLDFDYFYAPVKPIRAGQLIQLLAVGALSPQRRFEDVVTATAILRKESYDARALIICNNYWADQKYREEFISHIKNSGAERYIDARFEGVEEADMLLALKESHISVVPNSAKVWIATACEAMAAGLPLVLARTTSLADVLMDGKNALFFDTRRPEQIAEKIKFLLQNPKEYKRIATAGQRYVKDNLNFSEFVKEIIKPPKI